VVSDKRSTFSDKRSNFSVERPIALIGSVRHQLEGLSENLTPFGEPLNTLVDVHRTSPSTDLY